jgi:hypothetical protein
MSEATQTQTKQELHDDVERAKREAAGLADVARERGRERLEGAKRRAADETDRVADAVETTAERLESDGDTAIGGYAHSLATMMRQFAGGLRERDINEFASELATFARRQPAAFIAGSVALGFGVSRFLKASSQREHAADDPDNADDQDGRDALTRGNGDERISAPDTQWRTEPGSATELGTDALRAGPPVSTEHEVTGPLPAGPQSGSTHNGGAR